MRRTDQINADKDFERVLALQARAECSEAERLALTRHFRRAGSTAELRPLQAESLRELYEANGLAAAIRVGGGKTLITFLAARLLGARKPVLLLSGGSSMRQKTQREFAIYAQDWHVQPAEIMSYAGLGRVDRAEQLLRAEPDLLIMDEAATGARNPYAGCTKRIRRAIEAHDPIVMVLSGTLITDKLMDYWHLVKWALGHRAPVPLMQAEAERWAAALDSGVSAFDRLDLGPLEQIPGGFHEHLRTRKGVVVSSGKSDCDAALEIEPWTPKMPPELLDVIAHVSETKERPDGEMLDDLSCASCLDMLALGLYLVWDPPPPESWNIPRKRWLKWLREIQKEDVEGCDTELQIKQSLDRSTDDPAACPLPPAVAAEGRARLKAWRDVEAEFEPNGVPVWITDSIIRQAAALAKHSGHGTLVWASHDAVASKLAELGIRRVPSYESPIPLNGALCCVSIRSHGTGENLQAWHTSIVLELPVDAAKGWEQLLGRTHREGQKSPIVRIRPINGTRRHTDVLDRAHRQAKRVAENSGFSQKLVDATWL